MDFGADKSFGVVNVATKNLEEENSHLVQNLFLHLSVIHHLRAERKIISVTKFQTQSRTKQGREESYWIYIVLLVYHI